MNQLILTTISAVIVSIVAAYLGTLMLQRKVSLIAGPLGHLAIPGVALALIYGFDISLGAFPFVILGAFLIWYLQEKTVISTEALTAIIFASGVAVGFLFLPMDKAESALVGNITKISPLETMTITLVFIPLIFIIKAIFNKMMVITISEDLAQVEGIDVQKYKLIYFLSIAIVVAFEIKLVGVLLTAALAAIPAASARNLSADMKTYVFLSLIFAIISTLAGILLFKMTALPVGPLIIIINAFIFIASVIFSSQNK